VSQFSLASNDSGNLNGAAKKVYIVGQESFLNYCLRLNTETPINFLPFGNDASKMLDSNISRRFFARLIPC
jgi:hypothetical protein